MNVPAGTYLPPQLIFDGKTERCHPSITFPSGWDIWHSPNHWSNEDLIKRYVEKILVPFFVQGREACGLEETHPVLVIFDSFRGQNTPAFIELLDSHNIRVVRVPPNCTDKLQPLDVSVNKPVKDEMKKRFHEWYAEEVRKHWRMG